jgi:D-3-phosphoglycerate dehydrogenase
LQKREIDALSGRYFINSSRGELVDEPTLISALRDNKLAGAAVDVITDENGENHLSEWVALLPYRNIIVTPHIGGATVDSMARTELFMATKLKASISALCSS